MVSQARTPSVVSQTDTFLTDWDDLPVPGSVTVTLDNAVEIQSESAFFQVTAGTFSIPANATILGIEIRFPNFLYTYLSGTNTDDSQVTFEPCRDGAGVGGTQQSTPFIDASVDVRFGSATELWGTTWTPAQINGVWGFLLAGLNQTTDATVTIAPCVNGAATYTVTYSAPGFASFTQKRATLSEKRLINKLARFQSPARTIRA